MSPVIRAGVVVVDDRPDLLLTGDYPYYRDPAGRWAAKLSAMRAAGLTTISFYVPWRHHELEPGRFAFTGPGNRDLLGFLGLVQAAGLWAMPKPGPYVHAELPLGGLPDRVGPAGGTGRTAALCATGEPLSAQGYPLPSPHDPVFREDAGQWLRAVGDVLRPLIHPHGPVVAVQVGNEGWFGETALAASALDYSAPGVAAFTRRHPGRRPPRPGAGGGYAAWAAWLNESLADGLDDIGAHLDLDVPLLMNAAPPAEARSPGLDAWLSRSGPATPRTVHYGFTNWTGDLADDDELTRYVLAVKRAPGPAMEENWSLPWVSPACAAACVPIYRSLLGLACGATGISVYTGCATAGWDEHLTMDAAHRRTVAGDPALLDPPYGDAAPIGVDGSPGPGLDALREFTGFLRAAGPALAASRPEVDVVLLVRPEQAALTSWGVDTEPPADRTIAPFVRHCLRYGVPFSIAYREAEDDDRRRPLVTTSGPLMPAGLQELLVTHARAGRPLLVLGELPTADERGGRCTRLADAVRAGLPITVAADARTALAAWPPTAPRADRTGDGVLQLRRIGPAGDVFVFLFHPPVPGAGADPAPVTTTIMGETLRTTLMPGGCAVVHCRDGELAGAYLKGHHELLGLTIRADITFGDDRIAGHRAGDLSAHRHPSRSAFRI
ncbi:beta-galactosidase [Micromonospora schwarzwaldensis]|uniref:beta-galactosidase n=1 Tax=Micromonospora sp. DSM 45708 TaxID=3111767 RepID=UPI0031D598CC